jgi:hypothetical protein
MDVAALTRPSWPLVSHAMAPVALAAAEDVANREALIAELTEEDPFCPEPPEDAASWTEARLRAYFNSCGVDAGDAVVTWTGDARSSPKLTREQVR